MLYTILMHIPNINNLHITRHWSAAVITNVVSQEKTGIRHYKCGQSRENRDKALQMWPASGKQGYDIIRYGQPGVNNK